MVRGLDRITSTSIGKMLNKESKLYSIVNLKCPRCHEGDLFSVKNPFMLGTMLTMPHRCPVCQQDFIMEPGFYSGALWTSYPIVIGIIVVTWLVLRFYFQLSVSYIVTTATFISLIVQPVVMRLGRAVWINLFVSYRGRQGE